MPLTRPPFAVLQVQFEIAHNAIHAWTGGSKVHGMGHLHFTAYDPLFVLHHSNVDRIFAVWQELQRARWVARAECELRDSTDPSDPSDPLS